MTFQTPDTFFLVAVDFSNLGFGSANDITADWDQAVDDYADSVDPARVFRIEMDADNMPASIADVTANADETIAERRAGHLATAPVLEIDHEHDNPDPFDYACDMRREDA